MFENECAKLDLPIERKIENKHDDVHEENVVSEKTIERTLEMFDDAYEDPFFKVMNFCHILANFFSKYVSLFPDMGRPNSDSTRA